MDGRKKRLKESLQLQLLFWLSLAIAVVAIVAGIVSFEMTFEETHELQDDMLRQVAALQARQHVNMSSPGNDTSLSAGKKDWTLIIQYLAAGPAPSHSGRDQVTLSLPLSLPDGMQTVDVKGSSFRVMVTTLPDGERFAVAQSTEERDEIALNSALRTVMPFLLLMPILLVIVSVLVRKMFRPITVLAADIDRRGDQELHPVEESRLPSEIRPFVTAINRLLDRVARSVETQRRFVANAAHELRSPLTALSLQAERLAEADMSETVRERFDVLRRGIERNRHLLDQLLTLARAQSTVSRPAAPNSVLQVYRNVLEELMPLAEAKQMDIGIEGETDVPLHIHELDLRTVVKNLVHNAISYSPAGGRVDLSVSKDRDYVILQVSDSGPGIPPDERERVFDAFYRVLGNEVPGSGLGLSIVRSIAQRIGAEVRLEYADEKKQAGLCVRVSVPIALHA